MDCPADNDERSNMARNFQVFSASALQAHG
jgi:hypothetical protein